MLIKRTIFFAVLTLCVTVASAEQAKNKPNIGYLYPAGGQQGTVIKIYAGGQFLRGAKEVYVSGEGVKASVIRSCRVSDFSNPNQRVLIQPILKDMRDKRLREAGIDPDKLPGKRKNKKKTPKPPATAKKPETKKPDAKKPEEKKDIPEKSGIKMGDHPLLTDLESKSLAELENLQHMIFFPKRMKQINRQLSEAVVIEIIIEPDAKPGFRELLILTRAGLTNPMAFQVATLPEVLELEPNNKHTYHKPFNIAKLPKEKPLELPVILNGQIMPGDVDRFRFTAEKGQKLTIEAQARSLVPYLSDAVPGWFQATLALYDDKNLEVAFVDDYRFNPDPVMFYEIPKSGQYQLQIRDSIYRGREDFVYRVSISEHPFITQIFPLGGKAYSSTFASVEGWNLPATKVLLDTKPSGNDIQRMTFDKGEVVSRPITYAVGKLSESMETESNDTVKDAQLVSLPLIVNGRIDAPGDADVFKFKGSKDQKVVAEIYGRRLNSPVDSLLRLTDAAGTTLEWNDDYIKKDGHLHKDTVGLATHHADSYLTATLPEDGTYYVHLSDSQNRGGKAYGYRLRIEKPKGDFALRVTPSSLFATPGKTVAVQVYVLRKDGFDGEIKLKLKDSPGFKLQGGRIPAGVDKIRMTLTATKDAPGGPTNLQLQGSAVCSDGIVIRPALPADNVMQAFLYRHLVPSQQLLFAVQKTKWSIPPIELTNNSPIYISSGNSVQVEFKTAHKNFFNGVELKIGDPPKGLTMHDVKTGPGTVSFTLKADENLKKNGFEGNIIIEAFKKSRPKKNAKNKAAKKITRYSIGYLPAVPLEILKK